MTESQANTLNQLVKTEGAYLSSGQRMGAAGLAFSAGRVRKVPSEGQSRILLCELCDASFASAGGLSLHKASVHFQRKFVCSVCGKKFTRKEKLKYHMNTHNKPQS
ncbi:hypothetical protein ACOMHN_059014 [Nucella lapillus]